MSVTNKFNRETKHYLGDGAYVDVEPALDAIVLTTENGVEVTNTVVLEVIPLTNLFEYIKRNCPVFWERNTK